MHTYTYKLSDMVPMKRVLFEYIYIRYVCHASLHDLILKMSRKTQYNGIIKESRFQNEKMALTLCLKYHK